MDLLRLQATCSGHKDNADSLCTRGVGVASEEVQERPVPEKHAGLSANGGLGHRQTHDRLRGIELASVKSGYIQASQCCIVVVCTLRQSATSEDGDWQQSAAHAEAAHTELV